jgi:hypothetical protein
MAYGTNFILMFQRAAYYVARILSGTKPADLPVEQATKFELVVNGGFVESVKSEYCPNCGANESGSAIGLASSFMSWRRKHRTSSKAHSLRSPQRMLAL